jgi:transposase
MPAELAAALDPVRKSIEDLTTRIRHYDQLIDDFCAKKYPETLGLQGIGGVGPVTTLAFILTLEESGRFAESRAVGPFLGLVPRRDQSGAIDKQLRITKAGDAYLRRLLVGCAHYILGHFGPDCDLRRFGLKLAARGGKNAKRRAVVAVARKLGVLMHHLWKTGAVYDPLYQEHRQQRNVA